jgi:hypothetical protein
MYDDFKFTYQLNDVVVDLRGIKEVEEFFKQDSIVIQGETLDLSFHGVKFQLQNNKLTEIGLPEDCFTASGDGYFGTFEDARLFAWKLSKVLLSGSVDLYFTNATDGADPWGLRVTFHKVQFLKMTFKPDRDISEDEILDY